MKIGDKIRIYVNNLIDGSPYNCIGFISDIKDGILKVRVEDYSGGTEYIVNEKQCRRIVKKYKPISYHPEPGSIGYQVKKFLEDQTFLNNLNKMIQQFNKKY